MYRLQSPFTSVRTTLPPPPLALRTASSAPPFTMRAQAWMRVRKLAYVRTQTIVNFTLATDAHVRDFVQQRQYTPLTPHVLRLVDGADRDLRHHHHHHHCCTDSTCRRNDLWPLCLLRQFCACTPSNPSADLCT